MTHDSPDGPTTTVEVLPAHVWTERERRHVERVDALLADHPPRTPSGDPHPVWSFLFTYYNHRPAALRRWHPGFGTVLQDARAHLDRPGYRSVGPPGSAAVDPVWLDRRIDTVRFVHRLLSATASRTPRLGCFGMHEWAMVYRSAPDRRRHTVPLRLSASDTDAVVESMPLRCTHFDAFRFFTDAAVPRNDEVLTRDRQVADEQPGCLHAGMDLYKWAFKLTPLVDSDLVADAFAVALDARRLDMRAGPYDLRAFGLSPVPVETPSGRAQYVRAQSDLAERAGEVRHRLRDATNRLTRAHARGA